MTLKISMKNGIQLQTANTGQNETLHQRVNTINEREIAPVEWRIVAKRRRRRTLRKDNNP